MLTNLESRSNLIINFKHDFYKTNIHPRTNQGLAPIDSPDAILAEIHSTRLGTPGSPETLKFDRVMHFNLDIRDRRFNSKGGGGGYKWADKYSAST